MVSTVPLRPNWPIRNLGSVFKSAVFIGRLSFATISVNKGSTSRAPSGMLTAVTMGRESSYVYV
jgi:hypothetical protein